MFLLPFRAIFGWSPIVRSIILSAHNKIINTGIFTPFNVLTMVFS